MANEKCKICKKPLKGRTDKVFCSKRCKNHYHVNLRRATAIATRDIDTMLHRNRSILLEIMGKHNVRIKTNRRVLEKKKFNFKYMTHYNVNKQGKTYHHVYDFAWMGFSDDEVLIVRRSKH